MPKIHTYRLATSLQWIQKGLSLFRRQFIRLLLLFIVVSTLFSTLAMLPILGIVLTLAFMPLSQMLLFNAAFGIQKNGAFEYGDLLKKLNQATTWARLTTSTFLHFAIIYIILSFTLPKLPVSAEALMHLDAEQMASMISRFFTLSTLLVPIICLSIYSLLSIWVYPLIAWEESKVLPAFVNSFKASFHNFLPLAFLFTCFIVMTLGFMLLAQHIILPAFPSSLSLISLLFMHVVAITLYLSLFNAYMEIFYGNS